MKNISVKRLFRTLICLLLVCSLFVNFVFVRANASVATTVGSVLVPIATVVGAVLIGLGVLPVPEKIETFNTAVSTVISDLGLDDVIQVASYLSGGLIKTAVPSTLVNDIRNTLVKSAIVTVKYASPSGVSYSVEAPVGTTFNYSNGDVTTTSDCYAFFDKSTSATSKVVILASPVARPTFSTTVTKSKNHDYMTYKGFYFVCVDFSDSYAKSANNGYYCYVRSSDEDWTVAAKAFADGLLPISPVQEAEAAPDMGTGILALPTAPFETSYALWADTIITVPGTAVGSDTEEEIPYVPVGLGNSYSETITQTQEQIQTGNSTITNSDTQTGSISQTWLGQKIDAIASWLSGIKSAVLSLGETITTAWNNAIEAILSGIQAIFVPSEDFLTAKVEALRAEFSFADSIITSGQYIGNSLKDLGTEPPVIYINLADNRGPYDLGGEVPFLDLRWYAEYKPTGDAIISAFLWLLFAWRVYIKAPGIIRGIPGDVGDFRDMSGKH